MALSRESWHPHGRSINQKPYGYGTYDGSFNHFPSHYIPLSPPLKMIMPVREGVGESSHLKIPAYFAGLALKRLSTIWDNIVASIAHIGVSVL
jgi:hypothetical protein